MKVVYVVNSVQDKNTENPELIDGVLYSWKTERVKLRGTLKEEIDKIYRRYPDAIYLLINDVESTTKYFCDQGCKPGEGCKKYYSEGDHALIMSYYVIK